MILFYTTFYSKITSTWYDFDNPFILFFSFINDFLMFLVNNKVITYTVYVVKQGIYSIGVSSGYYTGNAKPL